MKNFVIRHKLAVFITLAGFIFLSGLAESLNHLKLYKIPTGSMEPTIRRNSYIIVDTHGYTMQKPERFDIVLFEAPEANDKPFVKRILGLPGEFIEIKHGNAFINSHKIHPPKGIHYAEHPFNPPPVYLKKGHYYLVGDNSRNSRDSRVFGPVSLDKINGKVIKIVTPR